MLLAQGEKNRCLKICLLEVEVNFVHQGKNCTHLRLYGRLVLYKCLVIYHTQERHLQDVIHAQQTNRNIKHVVIPTPENAIDVPYYGAITKNKEKPPAQYIRLPGTDGITRYGLQQALLGVVPVH